MTTYEDYFNFISENENIILNINKKSLVLAYYIKDIMYCLDYVYRLFLNNQEIDKDLDELFDIGFSYMTNFIEDLEYMLNNYFNNDFNKLKEYENVIFYYFQYEDLEEFLESADYLTDDRLSILDEVNSSIQECLQSQKDNTDIFHEYLNNTFNSNNNLANKNLIKNIYLAIFIIYFKYKITT